MQIILFFSLVQNQTPRSNEENKAISTYYLVELNYKIQQNLVNEMNKFFTFLNEIIKNNEQQ